MARRKTPRIPDALLDQLLGGADPKTAFDANGLLDDLKKALAERALNTEMDHHLSSDADGNSRNGYGRKTVTTDTGQIEVEIPRGRQATFDPQRIAAAWQARPLEPVYPLVFFDALADCSFAATPICKCQRQHSRSRKDRALPG